MTDTHIYIIIKKTTHGAHDEGKSSSDGTPR